MLSVDGIDCFPDCCPHVAACFVSTSLAGERIDTVDIRCMLYMTRMRNTSVKSGASSLVVNPYTYPSCTNTTIFPNYQECIDQSRQQSRQHESTNCPGPAQPRRSVPVSSRLCHGKDGKQYTGTRTLLSSARFILPETVTDHQPPII